MMKGELTFDSLLRVDGRFEGSLKSTGSLIVGKSGILVGNVDGMVELLCDGKIIGNISVERVELRNTCSVFGNITCKVFKIYTAHPTRNKLGSSQCRA